MTYATPLIKEIGGLLDKCGGNDRAMPATTLYNENWLLRLVLDWHKRNKCPDSPFSFHSDATWYSEGLLASPFLKGDKREKHTHADGVIGNVCIKKTAEIWPMEGARQLVVIEAKLGSFLSLGTKNSSNYDQAARNVGCLAHIAAAGKHCLPAETIKEWRKGAFAFYLVVPESRKGKFESKMARESIEERIRCRAAGCEKNGDWYDKNIAPYCKPDVMTVELVTWECVLRKMKYAGCGDEYQMFYAQCLNPTHELTRR